MRWRGGLSSQKCVIRNTKHVSLFYILPERTTLYALKGKLHIAALDGDHEGVKEALEQGADVDSIEVCKKTSKIKYYKIPVKKTHLFSPVLDVCPPLIDVRVSSETILIRVRFYEDEIHL